MRRYLSPSFFKATLLATVAVGLLALAINTAPTAKAATPSVATATSSEKQPIQFADEIIRRLRRLGLNFTKNRVANPYDPCGEVC